LKATRKGKKFFRGTFKFSQHSQKHSKQNRPGRMAPGTGGGRNRGRGQGRKKRIPEHHQEKRGTKNSKMRTQKKNRLRGGSEKGTRKCKGGKGKGV